MLSFSALSMEDMFLMPKSSCKILFHLSKYCPLAITDNFKLLYVNINFQLAEQFLINNNPLLQMVLGFSSCRYSDPDNPIRKKLISPIPAYENWVETQTIQELEAIRNNSNSLHMESLTIRERILGIHNPEVPHPIIYRGAVFADNARFDR